MCMACPYVWPSPDSSLTTAGVLSTGALRAHRLTAEPSRRLRAITAPAGLSCEQVLAQAVPVRAVFCACGPVRVQGTAVPPGVGDRPSGPVSGFLGRRGWPFRRFRGGGDMDDARADVDDRAADRAGGSGRAAPQGTGRDQPGVAGPERVRERVGGPGRVTDGALVGLDQLRDRGCP
jgi:hypothetical protein